jgi:hypothetical protein
LERKVKENAFDVENKVNLWLVRKNSWKLRK